jgi:hypothetical protein
MLDKNNIYAKLDIVKTIKKFSEKLIYKTSFDQEVFRVSIIKEIFKISDLIKYQ